MGSEFVAKGSVKDTWVKSPFWRIMRDCTETMVRVGGRFGLTPADRAGIDVEEKKHTPGLGAERILD